MERTNRTYIEYISIFERPKKKLERPKGTNTFTDEENYCEDDKQI